MQLHNDVTEHGPGHKVGAPHILKLSGDVPSVEEVLAVEELARVRVLVGYTRSVRVSAVDWHWLAVAQYFDTCNSNSFSRARKFR